MAGIETPQRRPTIVVGFDGSQAAYGALLYATRQAGTTGRIVIVSAFRPPPENRSSPAYDRILFRRRRLARELLDSLELKSDAFVGPEYSLRVIGGSPVEVLADAARSEDADEIVVGARGLGAVRALLGSVSAELLRIADRPVVVIPQAATELAPHAAVATSRRGD
jgi:nucleotide-binding universal stress UspA family protein